MLRVFPLKDGKIFSENFKELRKINKKKLKLDILYLLMQSYIKY
jgi:hypothetical protein